MIAGRTKSFESDERAKRLVHVQGELRSALENAPQIRQLFEEWVELRFSPEAEERVCQSH